MRRAGARVRLALIIVAALLCVPALWLISCSPPGSDPPEGVMEDVRFFAYQIQDQSWYGDLQKLIDSHYDLLVIDQTRSVKGEEGYDSKGEVARLKSSKNSTGGNKIVVCYIDVGEAESYRWYWRDGWKVGNPDWIVAPDPDGWDENYPVAFWDEEWKGIMKEAIDRIIEDGYDGIYLDWLEVYSFEPVADAARAEGLDARDELVGFVDELALYARSQKPGFLFIAQNAAELGSIHEYVGLFDGITQEAIWYDGGGDPDSGETEGDVPVDRDLTDEYLDALALWRQADKPVFDVEYAEEPANTERAYRLGADQMFKTYVTLTPLDALTETPPPGY
ncbi:MAG: endo alpha-1,4 polygalactosaminidase [Actinobacteria bacterium]|nr:endo alpha-1,4 polygalactosaminidase [Actinomycetota bacterium]MBU4386656.1 endo alpha-1,4 polygalactosaminidase [Actinomycetota bacterium]MBU4489838.1 endo alpha-1,4 polygalactosaminidase [Actinomycetota bacterium]MCG2796284.1 endo alpha-1,4 polygalactosaminidase [Actinomycetes bacterium]